MIASSVEKATQETYCVDFFLETDKGDLFSYIYTDDPYLTDKDTLPLLIKETAQKDDKFAGQLKALEKEFGTITARFDEFWLDNFGCSTFAFINDKFEWALLITDHPRNTKHN